MKIILLFLFFFKPNHIPLTELKQFAGVGNRKVTIVSTIQKLTDLIRFNRARECPEMLVFLFNSRGERISEQAFSKAEFYYMIKGWSGKLKNREVVCVLIGGSIYLWHK